MSTHSSDVSKYLRRTIAAVILIVGLAPIGAAQHDAVAAKLNASFKNGMAEQHIPGLTVAIVDGQGLVWTNAYGFADIQAKRPITVDTRFPIGSVSKTVIATAMMLAVEDKKLELDRDINAYIPFKVENPNAKGQIITMRHLASHVSSIVDFDPIYSGHQNYYQGGDNPMPLGDFLAAYLTPGGKYYSAADNFGQARPGEKFQYSNVGAALAAYAVQSATRVPFNVYTRERIFKPLGMQTTGWLFSDIGTAEQATLYRYENGKFVAYPRYGLATWPDGGLRTSAREFSRFVAMVINGGTLGGQRVMSQTSRDEMLTVQSINGRPLEPFNRTREALFWTQFERPSGRVLNGHMGRDPGVATEMAFEPAKGVGVVIFANMEGSDVSMQLLRWVDECLDAAPNLMSAPVPPAIQAAPQ
jgi:CubicO group peptidase (beta-lactamase class C family)